MNDKIFCALHGDAKQTLEKLCQDPKHVNKYRLVVTSPPYYKHRNYGLDKQEIGQEETIDQYLNYLVSVFEICKKLLTSDGNLFIIIGDAKRGNQKLMIPHKLAIRLTEIGYFFHDDIIWYKKNAISNGSKINLASSYEFVLFLSNKKKSFINMDEIRVMGNATINGTIAKPPITEIQFKPINKNIDDINILKGIIHGANPDTAFDDLPSTSEISWAYGYDPEKFCPTCYRKFKRHASRKRIGNHQHYPIFSACNSKGKNPGNVWEISTRAHHGGEHFAIFPEELIARIVKLSTLENDSVLDPFAGRGTSGIVSVCLKRKFTGIELYSENIKTIKKNIQDAIDSKLSPSVLNQIIGKKSDLV